MDTRENTGLTEADIIEHTRNLPGVVAETADEASGAPEIAWGDTFFHYDPEGRDPADRPFPFATIVTKDYTGFDTASNVDRPGVYRLNINVGRTEFHRLVGHTPAAHATHHDEFDYTTLDQVLPHPTYAAQGWISILNPGPRTADQALALITQAHARAAQRHR
ncbi:DUF6194 family protein [Saccharopolyspora hirsuta]|uniref:Erythromycin esterase n=1 Tax=Saccharopolyspora hirsuta TaxID=1837 RepID=A0A5M7C1J5_SACHI|nr:DUF6194 family protein [Saccharopolyspora hirsuta]KAA5834347.1 erythromycin esterase [Saccharopolyspora hirsuta]